MRAVAAEGIRIVCYNVMPVVDWTRTDLDFPLPTGATALRFDHDRFAAFDLHVLKREDARPTTTPPRGRARAKCYDAIDAGRDRDADQEHLGRAARRDHVVGESRRLPRAHRLLSRHHAGQDARQRRGVPRAGRRRSPKQLGVRLTLHPGRSAASAVRPAAHRLDRRRLPGAVRRGAVSGERHLPLRRQPRQRVPTTTWWRMAQQFGRAHLFRASALDPDRRRGQEPQLHRVRPSRRRREHDRRVARAGRRERTGARTRGASRSAPTTATACSTTSRRPGSIPAIPGSAG